MKDRVKRIPIEDLKENNEHSDQQKPSDDASRAELKPKTNEDLNAENPARQGRRQATEEELNNPLHGVKLAEILERLVAH